MAAATKLLWLNGGYSQTLASGDTVQAQGTWTFDGSGTTTFTGPLSTSNGNFTVDASGNVDASGTLEIGGSSSFAGIAQFNNDVNITGDLTVNGDIVSRGQIDVVIKDAFLDLSFGNSTAGSSVLASSSGGFTVTQARNENFVAGSVTAFPTSTSFTYADASGSTALQVGDVVAITGLPQELAENEGFFVVSAVSGASFPQTVTIESSAASGLPWVQTAFQDGTPSSAGQAYKANISVLAIADGSSAFKGLSGASWPVGTLVLASYVGSSAGGATKALFQANGAYIAVGAGSTTLQNAYDNGNQIVTASGDGNVIITGTEKLFITASGGMDLSGATIRAAISDASGVSVQGNVVVDFGTDTNVDTFTVEAANAITLTAGDTSGWQVTSGDLGLSSTGKITATSAQVLLDASGAQIDASMNNVQIDASAAIVANAPSITADASGAQLVLAADVAAIDASGAVSIDAGATSNITVSSGDLDLSAASDLSLTSATLTSVQSGAASVTALSILADASGAQVNLAANTAAIDASGAVNITGGTTSTYAVTSGDLDLSASADISLTSATLTSVQSGAASVTALSILADASGAQINLANNTAELDASGAVSIGAGANSDFTVTGADLALTTVNSGAIAITSAGVMDIDASGNLAINSSGGIIAIGDDAVNGAVNIATAGSRSLSIGNAAQTTITMDGAGISIDGTASSNFSVTGANLTLSTITSGDVNVIAIGDVDLSGATITGWSSGATSFTALSFLADASGAQVDLSNNIAAIDASGAISLDAGAASNFTVSSGDLTLAATTNSIVLAASEAVSDAIKLDASGGAINAVSKAAWMELSSGLGITVVNKSGGSLAKGTILTLVPATNPGTDYRPEVKAADCDSGTVSERRFFGVVGYAAIADNAAGYATSMPGSIARVTFASAPSSANVGMPVFLSDVAGQAVWTAPSNSGDAVVQIGYLNSAVADADGNYAVVLAPQFIGQIP